VTSLKGILKEAQRRSDVAQNVASPVSVRMAKRDKHKIEVGVDVPTPEEIRQIIAKAKGRWRPLIVTAIFTGLRSSELRGLTWEHVDLDARVIRVRQRADRWDELGSLKSHAGDRDIPIPPLVLNTLKELRLRCPKGERGLVFPNGAGNVESHTNIYRRGLGAVQKTCGLVDAADRQKYGLHALRHFYASWLIGQGFKPKRVQELVGHASIQMTFDVYGHWFPSEDDDHERLAAGELAVVG
jgi:integrase